jgi:hypothetical protein
MTEDNRITTHCNSIEQKEKIQFLIRNVKQKHGFKKTGDALEFIADKYVEECTGKQNIPEGGIIFK